MIEVVSTSKLPIVDTLWQTETGGHVILSLPQVGKTKVVRYGLPFYGANPAILDPITGEELYDNDVSVLLA